MSLMGSPCIHPGTGCIGSVRRGGSFWQLLTEATSVVPCHYQNLTLKNKYGLCGDAGIFFLWKDAKSLSSNLFSIFPKWGFSEKEFKGQFNSQWLKAGLMTPTLRLEFMAASHDHVTCRHHKDIPCSLCAQCGQDLIHFTWDTVAENVPSVSASRYPMPHLLLKLSLSSDAPLLHHLLFRHCLFHEQFPAFPGSYLVCLPSVLLLPLRTLGQCFIYHWFF